MPVYRHLPDELLVQIVKYLLPDDVDNFSKSYKEFHTIANRMLPRHEEFKDKYSYFFWGPEEKAHPIFLLRDILQNSEIVWYVKWIELELCDDAFIEVNKETWDQVQKVAMECKDGIIKTVKACPYLDDDEREHWVNAALSCDRNTIVALLACISPCLENIKLTDNWENEKLHCLVRKVDQAKLLDFGSPHAFSKLNHIEEGGSTPEAFTTMESFEPFSRLPAMRRYTGRYLHHDTPWTPPEEKSTITSLELYDCMIHIAALRSALSGIANLQVFTYEFWDGPRLEIHGDDWKRDWQFGEIILSLLEFACHSLVDLDLTRNSREQQRAEETRERVQPPWGKWSEGKDLQNYKDWSGGTVRLFMGPLREFQVLKYVRVQNEAFVQEDSRYCADRRMVHRLVDLLPVSVAIVKLATPRLSQKDSYQLLGGLPELKADRVPKLEMVEFESDKHDRKTPNKNMKLKSQADGIELIL